MPWLLLVAAASPLPPSALPQLLRLLKPLPVLMLPLFAPPAPLPLAVEVPAPPLPRDSLGWDSRRPGWGRGDLEDEVADLDGDVVRDAWEPSSAAAAPFLRLPGAELRRGVSEANEWGSGFSDRALPLPPTATAAVAAAACNLDRERV